jgi:hypothetical protein
MHYRVFYYFERSGESVASTSPVEMSAKTIREQMIGRLVGDDDYLGIMDARENVLQVMREPGEDRYWVELPVDAARASYGRFVALAELEELILGLPRLLELSQFSGLQYRPW